MGLPVIIGAVWAGDGWTVALAATVAVLALHEFALLVRTLRPLVLASYLSALAAIAGAFWGGVTWMLAGLLLGLLLAFVFYLVASTRQGATIAVGASVLGAWWIGGGVAHLVLLRELPEHAALATLTVLLATFAADTAAFFVGRFVGRHQLAPVVSPRKTWEGFAAGTVAAVAVAFFALYEDRDEFLTIWQALVLGGVVALAGVVGDLFESVVKRDMQVKDTGRILGGHGGVLDRIDALLFSLPAAYYLLVAYGWA